MKKNDDRYARVAFVEDFCMEIIKFQDARDHIIILIDANTYIKNYDINKKISMLFTESKDAVIEQLTLAHKHY